MAIDETTTRSKSMTISTGSFNRMQQDKPNKISPADRTRVAHFVARKNRIERWAQKNRSTSISDTAARTTSTLGSQAEQKRSDSSYSQIGRKLDIYLLHLSEQRQKVIERRNFDQKLFANKQALKHKDNPAILRTLSYVRKCCKFVDSTDDEHKVDPKIFLEGGSTPKRSRSRSPCSSPSPVKRNLSVNAHTQTSASLAETFLKHNQKHIRASPSSPTNRKLTDSKTSYTTQIIPAPSATSTDDDSQKRHVQFRINNDGAYITSQSAHVARKLNSIDNQKQTLTKTIHSSDSSYNTRATNSAPTMRNLMTTTATTIEPAQEQVKPPTTPRRAMSRITSARNSLQEFRAHPERFLSATNRYLPLLHRQNTDMGSKEFYLKQQREKTDAIKRQRANVSPPMSRLSDGSDLTYDEAKSFLSEEVDVGKTTTTLTPQPFWMQHERKQNTKPRPPTKVEMEDIIAIDTAERTVAITRLRDREYAHLNELIRTNTIEQILEPFAEIKTDENFQIEFEEPPKPTNQRRLSDSFSKQSIIKTTKIRQLGEILHSIDSLRCSDTADGRIRKQVDIEKNRAKLGILIF